MTDHVIGAIMKATLALSLLPLLAAASPVFNVGTVHNEAAPILSSSTAEEIPNSYIIVFKDHVSPRSAASHHDWVQDLHFTTQSKNMELRKRSQLPLVSDFFRGLQHTYDIAGSLLGYSGHFDDSVIEEVRRHPDVSTAMAAPHTRGELSTYPLWYIILMGLCSQGRIRRKGFGRSHHGKHFVVI